VSMSSDGSQGSPKLSSPGAQERRVDRVLQAQSSVDGAGVVLKRVFGFSAGNSFDPFLLLDHFGSDKPEDYIAGFPWHPHRGIETVTYLLAGKVAHGDSMGNEGLIKPGDAQWMTAGSGIIHQEMPQPGDEGTRMEGIQLWVNLPARLKMADPRYRAVEADEIPLIRKEGARIRLLAGDFEGRKGATPDLYVPVLYMIVSLEPGASVRIPLPASHNAAVYCIEGEAEFGGTKLKAYQLGHLPASPGTYVEAKGSPGLSSQFLLIAGQALGEPVAWGGPIVMNTQEELRLAFAEYHRGEFIKTR
jgi:redox-sensitive bicupin YhaK (pirin superfamily)